MKEDKIIREILIKNKDFKTAVKELWKDYTENWNLFSEPVI